MQDEELTEMEALMRSMEGAIQLIGSDTSPIIAESRIVGTEEGHEAVRYVSKSETLPIEGLRKNH